MLDLPLSGVIFVAPPRTIKSPAWFARASGDNVRAERINPLITDVFMRALPFVKYKEY
jgi:hypothetical protein